jgi:hypothetical protein
MARSRHKKAHGISEILPSALTLSNSGFRAKFKVVALNNRFAPRHAICGCALRGQECNKQFSGGQVERELDLFKFNSLLPPLRSRKGHKIFYFSGTFDLIMNMKQFIKHKECVG